MNSRFIIAILFKNYFIYLHFKKLFPFQVPSPLTSHLIHPPLCFFFEFDHPPTHQLSLPPSSIPLFWGTKMPQDQDCPLPLRPDMAVLCYLCSWGHRLATYTLLLVV